MEKMIDLKQSSAAPNVLRSAETSPILRDYLSQARFFLYHLWLFTFSDIKSVIVPHTLMAIANASSGQFILSTSTMRLAGPAMAPSQADIVSRVPLTLFWIWLNLLVECIANQRLPGSIQEDSFNKPWRPLPSKRISPATVEKLLFYLIPTTLALSGWMGDMQFKASAALMSFTWMYNDLDGANFNWVVRNALNACGLVSFGIGGTAVAVMVEGNSDQGSFAPKAALWFAVLWLVICTTIHAQDFADMEGDKARGRRSVPLLYGDRLARWSVAIPVLFWSIVAPAYWGLPWHHLHLTGVAAAVLVLGSGISLATLVLGWNTVKTDKWVLRLWCLWAATIFVLPVLAPE
jgi:4-hydroxybenzoate polyprenyltransferase